MCTTLFSISTRYRYPGNECFSVATKNNESIFINKGFTRMRVNRKLVAGAIDWNHPGVGH